MEQYFNDRNDCDMCEHQIMCGRDGDCIGCERQDAELQCDYKERDIRLCPVCEHEVDRKDMNYTRDCHGITLRLVCCDCWERLMDKGYDGEYYTDADEQIEDNY